MFSLTLDSLRGESPLLSWALSMRLNAGRYHAFNSVVTAVAFVAIAAFLVLRG
jgi:hypothetical protein